MFLHIISAVIMGLIGGYASNVPFISRFESSREMDDWFFSSAPIKEHPLVFIIGFIFYALAPLISIPY